MGAHVFLTGYPGWLSEALLEHWRKNPLNSLTLLIEPKQLVSTDRFKDFPFPVKLVKADVTDSDQYCAALSGITEVIHAAGVIHPRRIRDYTRVHVAGSRALAEAAKNAGVKRMVLLSSNAAGGKAAAPHVLLREDDPDVPLSAYGKSKKDAEDAVLAVSGLETIILRPCMFYAPPVPTRHQAIFERIANSRMPLFRHGEFKRSVVHIENLVQAVERARTAPLPRSRVFYIADAQATTYRGYIEAIARALGSEVRWLKLPSWVPRVAYRVDRLLSACGFYWQTLHLVGEADWNVGVSIDRARTELGYTPDHTLEEGMRDAVRWWRTQAGAGRQVDWTAIHDPQDSYRKKLVGDILESYVLPKYLKLFLDAFTGESRRTFLEIGAGNGDTTSSVLLANSQRESAHQPPLIEQYTATEVFPEGVAWLTKRGITATLANAEQLPFGDASYDHVVAFDVMHHVNHPEFMAREMLRVSRGKLLLTESNGLSVPRKLLELLPNRRRAGERSYTPWTYRHFFSMHPEFEITEFKIRPFLFVIGVPKRFNLLLARLSEWIERVPLLKWQCSTVLIEVHFNRRKMEKAN